jgi:RimJ/RimL family protein N-acetyltransferase
VAPLNLPHPSLDDLRITLRPWQTGDLVLVEQASHHLEITGITSIPRAYTQAEGHAWLARQHAHQQQRTGISLAISDTHTGQALGYVGVSGLDWRHLRGSLGYWVAPTQRRRGLATAAVRLLVPWAFQALGLVRIEAAAAVGNPASQRVLERNGFQAEGVLRAYYEINGVWTDMVMFARLAASHRRPDATEPSHDPR